MQYERYLFHGLRKLKSVTPIEAVQHVSSRLHTLYGREAQMTKRFTAQETMEAAFDPLIARQRAGLSASDWGATIEETMGN